ncbi:MAG: DUF59 domain-containing protein [Ignavibacteria bacterium]|nr:DUF59 domain-containing protein [Ignavibacteria bacterium]
MNQLVETQIREAVGQVADNDLGFTLAELNAISNIQLSDNAINVYLELIPLCTGWLKQLTKE